MKHKLIEEARKARDKAYVPYSEFKVGAALIAESGNMYTGCNIENASYSLTCCAERTAIFNAISQGEKELIEMAVIADSKGPVSPCGACRQVILEFFPKDAKIYLSNMEGNIKETTAENLLPFSFSLEEKRS